ncbi:hypothetical protein ACHQM5_024122 [Ranunculus cassubicifolius]
MRFGLPIQSEECISLMVEKECNHLPKNDYLERLQNGELHLIMARKEAIDWMRKVHSQYSFGPLSSYLSVNYLDRFLSNYNLPNDKDWVAQLLAVACLSLAAKMDESEVPLCVELQVGNGDQVGVSRFCFEGKTIQRMELLVLSTLKWRMQVVTPFSFIDYFLYRINDDVLPSEILLSQSIKLILNMANGIDFLEFKPSEVAAGAAISVSGETQAWNFDKAISCLSQLVQMERVMKCLNLINGFSLITMTVSYASISHPSTPRSPIGVLDASCLSYTSDESHPGSGANSSHASPATKRRKLNMTSEVDLKTCKVEF